jgi:hypothetical protein
MVHDADVRWYFYLVIAYSLVTILNADHVSDFSRDNNAGNANNVTDFKLYDKETRGGKGRQNVAFQMSVTELIGQGFNDGDRHCKCS